MPLLAAVGSRSILRDCIRRLTELRVACGKDDGSGVAAQTLQSTGDPFADRAQLFGYHVKQCRDAISERSEAHRGKRPEDRTAEVAANNRVVALIRSLKENIEEMQKLVAQSNGKYITAVQKKQSNEKIDSKKRLFEERNSGLVAAERTLKDLEKFNKASDERIAALKAGQRPKTRMRAALDTLAKAQGQSLNTGTVQRPADLDNEPYGGESIPTLAEAPEYRGQWQMIQQQKQEIDRGLDRIHAAVLRIKEIAIGIGDELRTQNEMLTETEKRLQEQADAVKATRKQVDMVLKKQKPMNICVNVFCFLVLLALVGFFLVKFSVV